MEPFVFFYTQTFSYTSTFVEDALLFALYGFDFFLKSQMFVSIWVCFWNLDFFFNDNLFVYSEELNNEWGQRVFSRFKRWEGVT